MSEPAIRCPYADRALRSPGGRHRRHPRGARAARHASEAASSRTTGWRSRRRWNSSCTTRPWEPEPASFGTTMRTPGDDERLAAGLLYGEGIVNQASDIEAIESSTRRPNVVNVRLQPSVALEAADGRRGASRPGRAAVCAAPPGSMPRSPVPPPRASPATGSIELAVLLRLAGAHARGTVEIRRHRRHSRRGAVRLCRGRCSASPRTWAGTTPSTSSSARICWPAACRCRIGIVLLSGGRASSWCKRRCARGSRCSPPSARPRASRSIWRWRPGLTLVGFLREITATCIPILSVSRTSALLPHRLLLDGVTAPLQAG